MSKRPWSRAILPVFAGMLVMATGVLAAAPGGPGLDVYVVYSGRDRGSKAKLLKLLSKDVKVKTYNVDLLAVADYSGKQKAIGKLQRARTVVFLGKRPSTILKGNKLKRNLILVKGAVPGHSGGRLVVKPAVKAAGKRT